MALLRTLFGNRWVRYAATVLLIGLVIAKIQPEKLSAAISTAHAGYLAVALLLTPPFLYLKIVRWHVMLRAAGVEATFGEAALSLIGGMGLALVTPARVGEVIRAAFLRDSQKMKISGLVMIDKAFDVLVLVALSVAGAAWFFGLWLGVVLLAAAIVGLGMVYFPRRLSAALHALSARTPARASLEKVWSSLTSLSPRYTTIYLALTVLAFLVVLLQFAVILLSWRSWSFAIVFLTFPLVILTNIVPLTVGGLGVREGVATVLLAHYGVPPAEAFATAFLSFTVNTALPGIVGALLTPSALVRSRTQAIGPANRP